MLLQAFSLSSISVTSMRICEKRKTIPEKRRYSHSQIMTAFGCGEKFRRTYVEREPRNKSILAMRRGSAVHKAAEHYAIEISEKRKPKDGEILEVAETTLKSSIDDSVVDIADDPDLKNSTVIVASLVGKFLEVVAPTITQVEAVEPYLTAKIEIKGKTLEIEGYPDLIDVDEDSGELRVRDYKTGKTYSRQTYEGGLQMPMYTLLATANGMPTDLTRIDHLRHLKNGAKHEKLEMRRGAASHIRLARLIESVDRYMDSKAFVPNPTSWMCNEGCDYWKACDFRKPDGEA